MDQRDRTDKATPGIIEEPRTGSSIVTSPGRSARNTNMLDLVGLVAATALLFLPLLAGALRG